MEDYEHFGLRITDASDGSVIVDDIQMLPAPYAWLSERSRQSEAADRLVHDRVETIALSSSFKLSPLGQEPKAMRVGQVVMLAGMMISVTDTPNGAFVGTLPAGMRPSELTVLAVHVSLASASGNAALSIEPSGDIYLISPNYIPGHSFFLNGTSFVVE